jgi:hypothetical protein
LQLKWVAPTETFLEFGGEIGDGSSFPGTDRNKNGIGSGAVYVHAGGEVGASNEWRAGLSYLHCDRTIGNTHRPTSPATWRS